MQSTLDGTLGAALMLLLPGVSYLTTHAPTMPSWHHLWSLLLLISLPLLYLLSIKVKILTSHCTILTGQDRTFNALTFVREPAEVAPTWQKFGTSQVPSWSLLLLVSLPLLYLLSIKAFAVARCCTTSKNEECIFIALAFVWEPAEARPTLQKVAICQLPPCMSPCPPDTTSGASCSSSPCLSSTCWASRHWV